MTGVARLERLCRRGKTGHGRPHHAGADLAAVPAGDADVHGWQNSGLYDLEDLNTGRCAPVTEGGDVIVRVFAKRDAVEF